MNDDDEYTVDELVEMSGSEFYSVVSDDLQAACDWTGPFQDGRVVHRTLSVMMSLLRKAEGDVWARREDPNCPADLLERTEGFYEHVKFVVENTRRRLRHFVAVKRETKQWKQTLFEVVDAILQGWGDEEILALTIPEFSNTPVISLEEWHAIRMRKNPDRKVAEHGEVAA